MTKPVPQKTTALWSRRLFAALALFPLVYTSVKLAHSGLSAYLILGSSAFGLAFLLSLPRLHGAFELMRFGIALLLVSIGLFFTLLRFGIEFFFVADALVWFVAVAWLFGSGFGRCTLVAVNVALALLILSGFEIFLKSRPTVIWEGEGRIIQADDKMSYRYRPNSSRRFRGRAPDGSVLFDVVYRFGVDGTREVPNRPEEGPEWWILGGSFAFGHGLQASQTIAGLLQKAKPDIRVINGAHNGHGTADVYLYLQHLIENRAKPEVVIYFLMDSHFWRTATYDALIAEGGAGAKPRFVLKAGRPVFVGKAGKTLSRLHRFNVELLKHSALYRRIAGRGRFQAAEVFPLMTALIKEMRQMCRQRGDFRFLVVRIPRMEMKSEVGDLSNWKAELSREGIEFLDFKSKFDTYVHETGDDRKSFFISVDTHPNPRYTVLISKWLLDYLNET